jgi:hypothetical protein
MRIQTASPQNGEGIEVAQPSTLERPSKCARLEGGELALVWDKLGCRR